MAKNNTLSYRVGQLEKVVEKLDENVDNVLKNDIPHIQISLSQLKTRVDVLSIINIAALVIAVVVSKIM